MTDLENYAGCSCGARWDPNTETHDCQSKAKNEPEFKIDPKVFWISRDPIKSFDMKNRFLINEGFFMDTNRDPPNFLWRFFQWVFFGFRWEKL